ncbi:MAG: hypothetical protein ACREQ9_08125 [Candidatus Binatia bacterium]
MRGFRFTRSYLRDQLALEGQLSPADEELLDRTIATIVQEPLDVPRIPSFYEPSRPSWLARSGALVIHYALDAESGEVVFMNLFRRG